MKLNIIKKAIQKIAFIIPIALPVYLAFFGVALVIVLILGTFSLQTGVAVLIVSALIASLILYSAKDSLVAFTLEKKFVVDLAVILFVGLWAGFNAYYVSQSVFITRDPGIYTVAGKWLQNNSTTNVKTINLNLDLKTARTESSGMWQDLKDKSRNTLQPQGMHLLPTYLGFFGRVFGDMAIYRLNVIFGGVAILAVYAYSRMLLKARYSWIPPILLSFTLPMIYFSRDTYTEPLAMLFVFGGLTLLCGAMKRTTNHTLWALSGFVLGAAALARPDTYLVCVAVTAALVMYFSRNRVEKKNQKKTAVSIGLFYFAYLLPALLAIVDIKVLTRVYFVGHGKGIILQLIVLGIACIFSLILFFLWHRLNVQLMSNWLAKNRLKLVCLLGALFMLIMLRPLLYTDYARGANSGIGAVIETQQRLGEPLEERTYTEITHNWISWYVGDVTMLLGVAGLLIAVYFSLRKSDPATLLVAYSTLVVGLLYLLAPNITPDQIWAVRRFLPVVIPGIIILSVFVLQLAEERLETRSRIRGKKYVIFIAAVLIYLLAQPLFVARPFLRNNEKPAHSEVILKLCDQLPDNALVVWVGNTLELDTVQTTRAYCGVSSVGFNLQNDRVLSPNNLTDKQKLTKIKQAADGLGLETYIAIHGSQKQQLATEYRPKFTYVGQYIKFEVQRTLLFPPKHVIPFVDSLELAGLSKEGEVIKVETK